MVPVSRDSAVRDHFRTCEQAYPQLAHESQKSHSAGCTHRFRQSLPYGDFENACKVSLSPHVAPYDSYSIFGPGCSAAPHTPMGSLQGTACLAVSRKALTSTRACL